MGAYFHQDWQMDGGSVQDTVAAFASEPRELRDSALAEIEDFLSQDYPEGELEARLREMGCDYYAGDTDDDYRQWLRDIRALLKQHSAGR